MSNPSAIPQSSVAKQDQIYRETCLPKSKR